jgi:hypothetical protein
MNPIFEPDGSLGDYPEIIKPENPPEEATKVEQKKWEAVYSAWRKETIRLDQDKTRLYGLLLGQMGDNSKNRIRETQDGMESMETNDPLQLLSAIIATHMTDNRLGAEHIDFKVAKVFRELIMQPGKSLASYHQKFRALHSGLFEAYRRAEENVPDSDFQEGQLALQFTMGLNSSYAGHKQYFEDAVKPWPESVEQAFLEASKFRLKREGYDNKYNGGLGRANAFTTRGRGRGRSGRGRATARAGIRLAVETVPLGTRQAASQVHRQLAERGKKIATLAERQGITRTNVGPKAPTRWVQGCTVGSIGSRIPAGKVSGLHDTLYDVDRHHALVSREGERKSMIRVTFDNPANDALLAKPHKKEKTLHLNTELRGGNPVIFSANVYTHSDGFIDRHILLDTCAGESVFKNRNLFHTIEPSIIPMEISGVNPKRSPLIITECRETDFGIVYLDGNCIANISFGSVSYSSRHDCYIAQVTDGGYYNKFSRDNSSNIYSCDLDTMMSGPRVY